MGRFLQHVHRSVSCTAYIGADVVLVVIVLASIGSWVDFAKAAGRGGPQLVQAAPAMISGSSSSLVAELMVDMKSPLSQPQASAYAQLFTRTGSVGDLCEAGHLYCDAETYASYYEQLLQLDEHVQDKDIPVFFRESELRVGRQLTIADPRLQAAALERNRLILVSSVAGKSKYTYLNVMKVPDRAFLHEELAKALPFTSNSASQVFNLDESSTLARESRKTVEICKQGVHNDGSTELEGEAAACATSLEGLQSLVRSPMLLGQAAAKVEALTTGSTEVGSKQLLQAAGGEFTGKVVEARLKASEASRHAVCHNLMYPSAVYFCHYLPHTRVYAVTLQQILAGAELAASPAAAHKAQLLQAVAMCHLDTNGWSPRHLAFQNLGTLPGQSDACHWVLQGSVAFVPVS